ncbi:MAG: DNA repair protein RecN [Rhodocyclaceae bacterium]|nr:DNA repair protein RecN [Rhodocyclaceae bacterium]
MLRSLQIRDFVIVDRLDLDFSAGFGALTGETGAGKSILLDALSLALGGRAETGVVRGGQARAEICADFDLPASPELADWLAGQGIDAEEGGLLLRRVVESGGRSRAWINGSAATLAQLRELGDALADIHGQHAHHALLRPDAQRQMLDQLAGATDVAAEVAVAWRGWRAASEARARAASDAERLGHERDLLAWQVQELEALDFDADGWQELNQEQSRLAHASSLLEGAQLAQVALRESEPALVTELERLASRLADLSAYDESLSPFAELLQSAAIQADEAAHGLQRYAERQDLDPARLQAIDDRIGVVTEMARKYRVAPEGLPDLLAEQRARLAGIDAAADPARLAQLEADARATFDEVASRLSARRLETATRLSVEVSEAMQSLAMAGGRFEVALLPEPDGSAHGRERVEFLVAGSPGQPLRPLGKVASGGELSRIGLAIQVIASSAGAAPTLIFDEVDVGIGGRVAEIVGQMLRRLGQSRQVLCVTHLPQVAAQADWQWSIAKEVRDGETLSAVHPLDDAGRVEEIARMLGGVQITRTTREHADEMLSRRD